MPLRAMAESRSADPDRIALGYRRARVYLFATLTLLAGTALYQVVAAGKQIWDSAHRNARAVASSLQARTTGVLEQSAASLMGIASDLSEQAQPSPENVIAILRDAMRFDPVSVYLGVHSAAGDQIVFVDHAGKTSSVALEGELWDRTAYSGTVMPDLRPPLRLVPGSAWYLPVTLEAVRGRTPLWTVIALVPIRSLLAGAESLQLLPDSWVSLIKPDGTRLLQLQPSRDRLQVGGRRVPREVLDLVSGRLAGTLDRLQLSTSAASQLPPGAAVAGYSRSPEFPLYVSATIPFSALYGLWLTQAAPQATVLLIGLGAIVLFARQLYSALRQQQFDLIHEEYRAAHDGLTGLLNRDAFMRLLERAIAARSREPFAVVMLDLNRFKDINDTLGHAQGDRVLGIMGQRLKALWREEEASVARLGGDELAVFARGIEGAEALEMLCARVQEALGQRISLSGLELNLAASMGSALYPQDARTPVELLRCADVAMYAAKADLRPFRRYSRTIDHFTPEMLALKSDFAQVLRERGLWVAYQPKIRLSDGALVGLEALSRWTHPTLGPVPPSRYVQLAEGTELIHPFTQSVLQAVLEQIAQWRAAGRRVPVSVNISANNLLEPTFVEKLQQKLTETLVPADMLELEITESAVMRYPETTIKRLNALRELGVPLAIDDFGTGYAALSYLKQLPVHTLKIDKSFVLDLVTDPADQRIVRSSIQLAHGFDMTVVAEGVESEAVAAQLLEYGCDYAQGFYFGQPRPAVAIRWT
jgi:diguanylate cyclase (GGDEF)-like protein